ncbi:MAG: stage V sporulation protein AE [Eubacterium sp.]|nr:stage V sporulation protein AE [Eubacterium sp.]
MVYLKAFIVGGIICTLVQIFLDNTRLMPGRVMVLLVIAGVILGAVGIYEPLLQWAGCGASVPLSGFGYNLVKGVMEAVNDEGFIGIFKGGLKAAAAGTSSALVFSYLAALVFQPKMKK